jgi:transcriptional regulator with XRE-family HTH domain
MPKLRAKPPSKEKVQVTFGAALRARRESLLLTQEKVAELADLHTNYVSSVERGERNVGLHNIVRLAFALDMPVASLLSCMDAR